MSYASNYVQPLTSRLYKLVSSSKRKMTTIGVNLNLKPLPTVSELSNRVIRVLGCNPGMMTLQGTNTYLIGSGKSRILVDTGEPNNDEYLNILSKCLQENNICIQEVVLTHWHYDHVGGIPGIFQKIINKDESVSFSKFRRDIQEETNCPVKYKYVSDGHIFRTEGASLKVMFTPGHSDDHICLYMPEEEALFSGDTVLGEGTTVFESYSDYMDSLNKIKAVKSSVIYPAHGTVVADPQVHVAQYIEHRNNREKQIKESFSHSSSKALSLCEIRQAVYKDLPVKYHLAAENNIKHHLEKLIKENSVFQKNNKYYFNSTKQKL